MTIVNQKPSYWITVRDNFWQFLREERTPARLYEPKVYRAPNVKSIGVANTVAEGNIFASGLVYDYTRQVQGAEITLGTVALERLLLDKAVGSTVDGGYSFDSSNDQTCEFAFGYYIEQRNGEYVYYWHPRCILTQADESVETSTDSAPEPNREFTLRVLPTSEGLWRVRYFTDGQDDALTPEEFFATCRYTKGIQAMSLAIAEPVVGSACTASITYSDDATPTSPTIEYQWYIGDTADTAIAPIDGATASTYTPAEEDVGKYLACGASVSGSALGLVLSPAVVVTEE